MEISKTQPMRSAEIEILDKVNELGIAVDSNTTSLGLLTDTLDAEVSDRRLADTALGGRIDNEVLARQNADTALGGRIDNEILSREGADTGIMNIIGSGFSNLNTVKSNIEDLQEFENRFRVGMTQPYTIAASGTQAISVDFNTPYESTDEVLVLINPIGASESFTDLKCVLDSAGYVGFSATIENSDTVNSYTVALGFVAVKVN